MLYEVITALATAAAYFGLECEIHMGEVDIAKEHPNVVRMKILGAEVVPVRITSYNVCYTKLLRDTLPRIMKYWKTQTNVTRLR